jgi:hypothetical protein
VSTILKALQRLEDEKSANSERSLDEQVVARRSPPDPERRGLKIGIAAIGGFAVVAAALLFWFTREDPEVDVAMESPPPAAAPAAEAAQKVAAEKPRRMRSARTAPAARAREDSSEVEVSPVVEVVKRLDAPPDDSAVTKRAAPRAEAGERRPVRRPTAGRRKPRAASEAAEPKPAPNQVADAALPVAGVAGEPAPVKPAPAPPTPVETAAVAPEPASTATSASIPAAIREPEQEVVQRAEVPTLNIEKTIWHPDADRRLAVVKLVEAEEVLRLKEGDAVGPLVVKAIKPGSVLFSHDGIEIVYNVGS